MHSKSFVSNFWGALQHNWGGFDKTNLFYFCYSISINSNHMNIETTDNSPLLQECIEELISSKIDEGKGRTAGNYRSAWNKLSTFLGSRVTEFTFADLTTDFLHHYLLWLMQGEDGKQAPLKPGSLDFYIRILKTMYNKIAQDKQMDVPRESPFSGLQIKVPPTRKRALPSLDLQNLATLERPKNPHACTALHLALFLFYARGMCFVDVFNLRHSNINDDYIHYVRSKTGVAMQVKITPEMKNIIFSYRRFNNPWIFPFLHEKISGEGEVTAQSALRRVNRHLKKMGEQLHFEQPFTTYVMRHSWASMMLEANSEIGIISQSLGHMSLRTTEIYLGRISVSKIDRASDNMLNNLVRGSSSRQRSKNKVMALRDNPPIQIKETIGKKCKKLISSIASKLFSFI